ncbi:hypothetical protein [Litorisediminicola beolgyonensis]|uniref:DUF2846 domain-containing protein n=1 Tax=Litorisediminicola beolgyonensis TaxID=1173614 RepID=A0ABW3ZF56_9RHOB
MATLKRHRLWALATAATLTLSACTDGPSVAEARAEITPIPPGQARIAVYRTQKVQGFGVKPTVLVDGLPTGLCAVNSVFHVDLRPGRHTVSASTTETSLVTLDLAAGETGYVLCSIAVGPLVGIPELSTTERPGLEALIFTGTY